MVEKDGRGINVREGVSRKGLVEVNRGICE